MTEENNKVSYITPFHISNAENVSPLSLKTPSKDGVSNTKWCKADDNKIINEACIRWAKKMDECIMVCTKSDGCSEYRRNLHSICKINNPESYNKMIKLFE
jgi:hypothetical protein